MPTTRINHDATQDFVGTKIGTLFVTGAAARAGNERRYTVRCERCAATNTVRYSQLRNESAKCLNANCGRPTNRRERLSESQRTAAEIQEELDAAQQKASIARMAAETNGYERPTRYTPMPDEYVPMSERERLALRDRREAEERDREEAERPAREKAEREQKRIADLKAEYDSNLRQLHTLQREKVANGVDEEFTIDPATQPGEGRSGVPASKVAEWQQSQFAEFLKNNSDYFRCDENSAALSDYLKRNSPDLILISAQQLTQAFKRLQSFGLMKERPAPAPQTVIQQKTINLRPPLAEPVKPQQPVYDGWDEEGNPRQYTERQVSRWSSEEMKRRLRLYPDKLALPNVGPGPNGRGRTQ